MRILIIFVCIFVVLLTAVTIIVGSRTFEGVVVEKPYEAGLAWDAAERQRTKLGWKVSLAGDRFLTGGNELIVAVTDRDSKPLREAQVTLRVSRPSTTSLDKTYTAHSERDGRFRAQVELARYGNWDVIVSVKRGKEQADYTLRLHAERTQI